MMPSLRGEKLLAAYKSILQITVWNQSGGGVQDLMAVCEIDQDSDKRSYISGRRGQMKEELFPS
jgi:hypothetical protein